MTYTEPKTYKESAVRVLALADRLLKIKRDGTYSNEDARGLALSNCRLTCLAAVMVLNILTVGEEGRINGKDFKRLVGMISGTAQDASAILEKNQRLSFIVIFQFQIENLLRNLFGELKKNNPPKGFYNLAKEIVFSTVTTDSQKKAGDYEHSSINPEQLAFKRYSPWPKWFVITN